ncbi:hypothetical protein JXA88_06435 [Candidatus Fermentibacteria bacterium]|nr:hypothetical protein [Candidatus Fermentibacteria bacterium]
MRKPSWVVAGLLALLLVPAEAARRPDPTHSWIPQPQFTPTVPDATYPSRVTWAGVGQLRSYTVTNVGLLGLYEPPIGWDGYDGTWPDNVTNWNGFCCEWPAGSRQYYNFTSGLWVGGIVPRAVGADTIYTPVVVTGAWRPDCQPLSPLWTSNQLTEPAEDGQTLFAQPGEDPQSGQLRWGDPASFPGYLYYAHTDTASINPRRRAAFGTSLYDMQPTDFVSQMDTYCTFGDYESDQGRFLAPSDGYDAEPLGIRLTQRSFSWGYGFAANYLYVDYKITNMNPYPIDSVYVGYFMDNDVGSGDINTEGVGGNDDLIGFDVALNLGYSYDSDFNEPGWSTSAGYIGIVLCETPRNPGAPAPLGLTAFSTWDREGPEQDVDNDNTDALKYAQLRGTDIPGDPDPRVFETFEEPQDVRHLSGSGPYLRLDPGETISVTLAIVMGQSLDDLKENTRRAIQQFEMGYLGTAPPPSPRVTATPQDRRVYLSWDDSPEHAVDYITGERDFEGYRVYRSRQGIDGTWQLLADYDVADSHTPKAVSMRYVRGGSVLQFGFAGFWGSGSDTLAFTGNDYVVEFQSDSTFTVLNADQQSLYRYNAEARDIFTGDFCVVGATDDGLVYPPPDPGNPFLGKWMDGTRIYIDGFYVQISAGAPDPEDPTGTTYLPLQGDLFAVAGYGWREVGQQSGLFYSYLDENLTNGLTYYYAVTSYDRGAPSQGIDPLESSTTQARIRVVPRSRAADRMDPDARWSRVSPSIGTGELYLAIGQPSMLTGHTYRLECLGTPNEPSWQWALRDVDAGRVVTDTMDILRYDFRDTTHVPEIRVPEDLVNTPLGDGLLLALKAPVRVWVESAAWNEGSACSWVPFSNNWNQYETRLEPYSYAMTFPSGGGTDIAGNPVPWQMMNLTLGIPAKTHLFHGASGDPTRWDPSDYVMILKQDAEAYAASQVMIRFSMDMSDNAHPAGPADTMFIESTRPFYGGDAFEIRTASMLAPMATYDLGQIRVVPNPYYLRATWDTDQYNRWVLFQHLPSRCTIRIFTVSGLLVRELAHATDSDDGSERWDLLTQENMHCTSGLYVYQVEDRASGATAVGKFAIVR